MLQLKFRGMEGGVVAFCAKVTAGARARRVMIVVGLWICIDEELGCYVVWCMRPYEQREFTRNHGILL